MYAKQLARTLILGERFDLTLYKRLRAVAASPELQELLRELIEVEEGHAAFWEDFWKERHAELDFLRKLKLELIVFCARLFGGWFIDLVLEAIEVHGIQKYLRVWRDYRGTELEKSLGRVLEDEFKHEDKIVARRRVRRIDPSLIRDILFGFNDGLVEILGAVSGFFAAFREPAAVVVAGFTVAVSGAISMAAGAFAAASSEGEVKRMEAEKERFLQKKAREGEGLPSRPWRAAFSVGISYFVAAVLPIIPVLLGAVSIAVSFVIGVIVSIAISTILSFISGMNTRHRIGLNLFIIAIAVTVTFAAGTLADFFLHSRVF